MKKIISGFLLMMMLFVFTSCGKQEKPMSFEENCWEQVENVETVEKDDGAYSVTLTAPDYAEIIQRLAQKGVTDITTESLAKAVKENPDAVKEYSLIAESDGEDAIQDALMEQIALDMLAVMMKDAVGEMQ
ncbi:MAG: hypothetical protein IJY28_03720 [Clostridia bacterium]|nr:hypothetical protein [Clostridia bacterium]